MDITSKASITVTARVSMAEVGDLVLDHVQAEVIKDAAGLNVVSRSVHLREGGSADVELVYEKVDVAAPIVVPAPVEPAQQPAQDAPVAAIVPLVLQMPGAAPAAT